MIPWDKSDERCCLSLPIFRAPSIFIEINLKLKLFISMSRQQWQQHHSSVGWLCACDYDFFKNYFFLFTNKWPWSIEWTEFPFCSLLVEFFLLFWLIQWAKDVPSEIFSGAKSDCVCECECARHAIYYAHWFYVSVCGIEWNGTHNIPYSKAIKIMIYILYSHFKGGKPSATSTNLCCCSAALPHCCHSPCVWKSNQK